MRIATSILTLSLLSSAYAEDLISAPAPSLEKFRSSYNVNFRAEGADISSQDLTSILTALPAFYAHYGPLNGHRVKVRDAGNIVEVSFYDPVPEPGCRGNCGRGNLTVTLSKPDLRVLTTSRPR